MLTGDVLAITATVALIGLIVAFAAFAQTVAGFGFALLAVPPLGLVIDPKDAVAVSAVLLMANSVLMVHGERAHIHWGAVRTLLVGAVPGLPLGLVVLAVIPVAGMRLALAVVVLLVVALLVSGFELSHQGRGVELGAGFLTGLLTTSLNTNGPPTVAALQARRLEPEVFRPTTATVLGATSLAGVVLFALAGRYHADVVTAAGVGLPSMMVGWLAGTRARRHIPALMFRRLVLALLVGAALAILATTL